MEVLEITCATIEDIYDLPEGQRAELINGQLYMMAPPGRRHQEILNYLNTEINMYIRKKKVNARFILRRLQYFCTPTTKPTSNRI